MSPVPPPSCWNAPELCRGCAYCAEDSTLSPSEARAADFPPSEEPPSDFAAFAIGVRDIFSEEVDRLLEEDPDADL